MTDAAGGRNGTGRPIDRRGDATARRDAAGAWRIACFTCPTLRVLVATLVALALAAPVVAHAGRQLTRAEAAEVQVLLARAQAGRQAKVDRRRATADKKRRTRDAKMAAALGMAIEYKAPGWLPRDPIDRSGRPRPARHLRGDHRALA